jgi:NLI interacting factor-like phosphatase
LNCCEGEKESPNRERPADGRKGNCSAGEVLIQNETNCGTPVLNTVMRYDFRTWFEASEKSRPRYIFFDLDQTLVHGIEEGWLKECPDNKDYVPMLVAGKHPYPEVKTIHITRGTYHIFPRPRLKEFLENCVKIAGCYCLSHNKGDYVKKVLSACGVNGLIKEGFTTTLLEPGSLGKQFDLDNAVWVLVDNMKLDTVEIVQKLRILGLSYPHASGPDEEGRRIVRDGREHFVHVENWYPTVDEHADNGLFEVMSEIKQKLQLN